MKTSIKICVLGVCLTAIGGPVSEAQVEATNGVRRPLPIVPSVLNSAPLSFLSFTNLVVDESYQAQSIQGWYWTNQPVSFTATNPAYSLVLTGFVQPGTYRLAVPPIPDQAFATAVVSNGVIVGAKITAGGSGYTSDPAVNFRSRGGKGAMAVGETDGAAVTNIVMLSGGSGYTNTPTVQIDPPPANAGEPMIQRVLQLDTLVSREASYQLQSAPAPSGPWTTMNSFSSSSSGTYSQYLVVSNPVNFFRVLEQ